jgi:hypothetical protein
MFIRDVGQFWQSFYISNLKYHDILCGIMAIYKEEELIDLIIRNLILTMKSYSPSLVSYLEGP